MMADTCRRALVALVLGVLSVLAAACGGDDDGGGVGGDVGGGDDRQVVIDHIKETSAAEGLDLTDEEAGCMLDVASGYADIGTLADAARQGEAEFEAVLSDEEETEMAVKAMSECPGLAGKLAGAVAGETGG